MFHDDKFPSARRTDEEEGQEQEPNSNSRRLLEKNGVVFE